MTKSMSRILVAALLLLAPATAVAQDGTMTFGEEAAEDDGGDDEGGGDQADSGSQSSDGEGDGTMTFGEDSGGDSSAAATSDDGPPTVGIAAVPTETISSSQRSRAQNKLRGAMEKVPDVELQSGPAVLEALKKRTVATCVTEPLCLGSVGEEAGVDRLVLVRIVEDQGSPQLNIDYFNVSERLFIRYETVSDVTSVGQAIGAIEPAIGRLFELGQREGGQEYAEQDRGAANQILGFVSAGLSAVAIGSGVVLGVQAQNLQGEYNNKEQVDGQFTDPNFTPRAARDLRERAQSRAQTANILYGLGVAFAGGSAALFLLDSGGESEESSGRAAREEDGASRSVRVAPILGDDRAGLRADFRF